MIIQFTREDLIQAIKQIDNNSELLSGRHSSTYDLIFEGKKYPPILILSIANKSKNGKDLKLSDFGNNTEQPFKILRENGFKIESKKNETTLNLIEFIKVANDQETGKGTKDSATQYKRHNKGTLEGLKIEMSFGVGRASSIPWIAFTGFGQTVKDGIYPVFLYYKEYKKLILAYGLSETNTPSHNWSQTNAKETIKQYFQKELSINTIKYGTSYIYKTYDIATLQSDEVLHKDLKTLINEYNFLFSDSIEKKSTIKEIKQVDFNISSFEENCKISGLNYNSQLITRYVSSLATKPFVLLSGLSGSGKTKLAQAFAQWICENDKQYCIVPVGADWTNREPLLGYVNALNNKEYILPENGALKLLIEANKANNKNKPYFLILDEMNLSHVERYFADFLSIMESKDQLKLHSDVEDKGIVSSHLNWPKNLFIVGTVNIDETTYMFSPKVLDRANVIEFRVNKDDISKFLDAPTEIDFTNLNGKGAGMGENFIEIASNKEFPKVKTDKLNEKLVLFFEELKKTGAEFGYRTATEIHRLYNQLTTLDNTMLEEAKIDIAIMQKLLPKLHGSRRKLCPILETLASFCVVEKTDVLKAFLNNKEAIDYKTNTSVLYPLSLEKITRMYKGAVDNGFASYAEA
ncbi:MrcB family domain-containing protein [Psychroserpens sp. NJDZ02]|uniref:MrcB family domain-containing protein n=1 Tax=Psychroserpens sp. NJDZ02 TaxID=2570561 RepID=UPI0010A8B1F4|nr:DUF3578 domain-containing protein [Psychroserpens sp. NJDZ02]QCE41563.1 DUF3578 domain-containing protein [Psychroserpens sp. NJDZ02]